MKGNAIQICDPYTHSDAKTTAPEHLPVCGRLSLIGESKYSDSDAIHLTFYRKVKYPHEYSKEIEVIIREL